MLFGKNVTILIPKKADGYVNLQCLCSILLQIVL